MSRCLLGPTEWTSMRIRFAIGSAPAALAVGAAAAFWPLLSLFVALVWDSAHPEPIDRDSKAGWEKCEGAIAGQLARQSERTARCRALSMRVNEAPPSPAERDRMRDEARRGEGCSP
jgi:hypothetical protein